MVIHLLERMFKHPYTCFKFLFVRMLFADAPLDERPHDRPNEHVKDENQEQLELPVCRVLDELAECFKK